MEDFEDMRPASPEAGFAHPLAQLVFTEPTNRIRLRELVYLELDALVGYIIPNGEDGTGETGLPFCPDS